MGSDFDSTKCPYFGGREWKKKKGPNLAHIREKLSFRSWHRHILDCTDTPRAHSRRILVHCTLDLDIVATLLLLEDSSRRPPPPESHRLHRKERLVDFTLNISGA